MDHKELLEEARDAREGMTRKEMWDWIFDHTWAMNKELGELWGRVDLMTKGILAMFGLLLGLLLERILSG